MTIWVDAQLSPFIALHINNSFPGLKAVSLKSLGLNFANDQEIYDKAKAANVVVMSKDYDFVKLLRSNGPPPKLIWITCGNTSNAVMCNILNNTLETAISLLNGGEILVEINKAL